MTTPVDDWKGRLPAAWRDFGRRLKGAGVTSTYAALAAATLWPLIELAVGQPGPAVQKIGGAVRAREQCHGGQDPGMAGEA